MSLTKSIRQQLGLSNTPANNFTLDASADNGTMKLARGNAGATTQDILTVDANGNVLVAGNNLNLFSAKSLASSGYQKLPGGLIIQWATFTTSASGQTNWTFPVAFPTAMLHTEATLQAATSIIGTPIVNMGAATLTTVPVGMSNNTNGWLALPLSLLAIGY